MANNNEKKLNGTVIVTYRCNARCSMCNRYKAPSKPEEEISIETIKKLPKMYFTNITGGEPFIRTDLKDIVRELYKKSDRIVISTNGFFTDRIVDLCKEFPQIGIRISIEGLEQTNNEIRGLQNGYQRGYGTLKKLREMGMKDVGFGMTVQDKNAPDLVPLYKISDEMGMEFATASLHNSFYFVEAKNIIHDRPMVAKNFENLVNELLRSNSPKKWFRAYFNHGLINYIYGQKRLLPCDMSFDTFFIDPYGDVMPCNGTKDKEVMGGAQVTPKPLKVYEKNQLAAAFREFVNKSCSWNPFYKKALRSYYKIYCINNETQKQISRIVGKDVSLMPELALRDEYKNLPIQKRKNDILKIVFVGRLIGKKGIAFLVDALSLMPADMDWELLIFGDGDDRALIEKQIADSGIGKNVKLMGNRPLNQIAEAYQQADVFVLPSLRETSGNVLLEAMAYAVPIVAFDTSFCRLLKEVDCGVFVNTEQALDKIKEDYCKAIVTLGQDKELAKQMGLNGYKYVNSKLTWDEKYRVIVNDM